MPGTARPFANMEGTCTVGLGTALEQPLQVYILQLQQISSLEPSATSNHRRSENFNPEAFISPIKKNLNRKTSRREASLILGVSPSAGKA